MPENTQRRKKAFLVSATPEAVRSQPQAEEHDLRAEVAMLRAVIRQVSERSAAAETMGDLLRLLDGLGRASVRLANLLRAQRELAEEQTAAALIRALDEVNKKR
jgi:hypothetical protein